MSDALSIALNGFNAAVARTTQAANNVVNASSTSENFDSSLVALTTAKANSAADLTVIKTVRKIDQSLLDILA